MKKIISIIVIVAVLLGAGAVSLAYYNKYKEYKNIAEDLKDDLINPPEPKIDVAYINEKLENISSLQTAKLTYGCMVDFEEGSVPFITKSAFSMYYEATACAAIEVSEIKCEKKDGKFILTLPEATIQDPNIDENSLEFYDVKSGLLNRNKPEDVAMALQYANKDFYYQPTTYQLLDMADKNAVDVLTNLLLVFLEKDNFEVVSAPRSKKVLVNPPMSSTDKIDKNYLELEKLYKQAGFTNIVRKEIKDIKMGVLTKEGEVERVTIDGKTNFKKTNVFSTDVPVVIEYHTKAD